MTYALLFTESYTRRAKRFLRRHPEVLGVYEKTLRLLASNPRHPSLHLHKLSGRLSELHAVSVTLSYRMVISFKIKAGQIIPIDIGTHDHVY